MCISKDEPSKALKAITDNFCVRNSLFDMGINVNNLREMSIEERQKLINSLQIC
jgi:rRNA maturation endonuclease Nob1